VTQHNLSSDNPPLRDGWTYAEGVLCVVCPVCAFTFDAFHDQANAPEPHTYACPDCGYFGGES
jgi:hypothetical protein